MEGLDNQENLTDLSLYNNCISEVQGLSACLKLNVLSLGNNRITQKDKLVDYLKSFKHLQVINLQGNDIAKEQEYKTYIVAHLKYLKYIDYSVIDEETRNNAKNDYMREDVEAAGQQEDSIQFREEEYFLDMKNAHIECTINLFEEIEAEDRKDDQIYEVIRQLPCFEELNEQYKHNVEDSNTRFQNEMIKMNRMRMSYIQNFQSAIQEAEERSTHKSIELIQEFQRKKKSLQKQIDTEELPNAEYIDGLRGLQWTADELEEQLMDIENELVESIEEKSTMLFKDLLKEIVEKMKQKTQDFATKTLIDGFTKPYNKELVEEARRLQEKYTQGNQQEQYKRELADILQDKEILTNALNQSSELQEDKITQIEKKITGSLVKETESLQKNFEERQHERNRDHIREICELLDKIRQEIEEQLTELLEDEEND